MDHITPRTSSDKADEINLIELAQKLLAQWHIIGGCIIVALLAGFLTLHLATYTYTAELKVTPVQNTTQSSLSLGQLRGLASLAGLSLRNNQGATPFFLYVESVASRAVADELAKNADLMKITFRSEWDAEAKRFVERSGSFEPATNAIKALIGIRSYPWTLPDGARLQLYLQENVGVVEDNVKPITTLRYEHEDPAFAVAFLVELNRVIDNQLRRSNHGQFVIRTSAFFVSRG